MYAIIIQDGVDYLTPELYSRKVGSEMLVGIYASVVEAQEAVDYLGEQGFPKENYFIAEMKRI